MLPLPSVVGAGPSQTNPPSASKCSRLPMTSITLSPGMPSSTSGSEGNPSVSSGACTGAGVLVAGGGEVAGTVSAGLGVSS
jgi:hypothetical protein